MPLETELAGQQLTLKRYPVTNNNLQAWDAADHHLLKVVNEAHLNTQHCLLINDSFGALACGLNATRVLAHTDSKVAQLGCQKNIALNGIDTSITWIHLQQEWPKDIDLVLMKLPRNLNQLDSQLIKLSQTLTKGTRILIAGKAKNINRNIVERCAKHIGQATPSLAWKNTRVIDCIFDGKVRPTTPLRSWPIPEYNLNIDNLPNVFAGNSLDIGARLMLQHIPNNISGDIVDLGCGNGVLGLRAAQLNSKAQIHFVDESKAAVDSAFRNWQNNFSGQDNRASFHWNDCLSGLTQLGAELVLCNPPFHQGDALTDHIAWQMLNDAKRVLKPGGILLLVGNRHLGYHIKMQRVFGEVSTIASDPKFVILQSKK
ncbi:methyltransferase [Paraferrimonas haliotis]|uniref:Ribosomal RNA large subunit methyltransferase G n=1 Tax=Paraferrimonas haliotis TaxID=2013866 RepID=A0AA37WW12_9GAMM|nr:methyltransferase [Paraferrimonas haliotis]GLS82772.1 ribosomal RNA large subunit methyltransferase G [Paraferrimonas haliotis]